MALDSSDLQQRRPKPSSSGRPTRTKSSGIGSGGVKRRRRKAERNNIRTVCIVISSLVVVILPLDLLGGRLFGNDSSSSDSAASGSSTGGGGGRRFLQNWKPKSNAPSKYERLQHDAALSNNQQSTSYNKQQREDRYNSLYRPKFSSSTLGYDIYNCPPTPPQHYPMAWPIPEVLTNWNVNDVTTIAPNYRQVYQGLCIFDYNTQYDIALTYRNAELPFVIRGDPKVERVVEKWDDGTGEYLHSVLGDVEEYRTERSPTTSFMWYRLRGNGKKKGMMDEGYTKPLNDETEMTFGEWLEHALEKEGVALQDEGLMQKAASMKERRLGLWKHAKSGPAEDDDELKERGRGGGNKNEESEEEKQKKWYYFRLNVDLRGSRDGSADKFVYDELSFFDPRKRKDSQFYIVDPKQERGINCRFGMRGVSAVNHFDMSRNMIALFGGERRYIIGNPSQCKHMALYPRGHPSLRHSSIDWGNEAEWANVPGFREAEVTEVVMHAGDVLYLPTSWFHQITNLGLNYQCNARSGVTYESSEYMDQCGFGF